MAIVAIRTALIYVILVAAMRVMGKRQLGDLQPTELVVTLLIADMAAVAIENIQLPLLRGVIPILVLVSLELLISGLMLKVPAVERLVDGHPVIVIDNGRLDQAAMKKLRLSIDDVLSALRQQGVFDLKEVQYAIAETGGNISVYQKPAKPTGNGIPFLVVSDGQVSHWGLRMCGQDEAWLQRTLAKAGCALSEVFLLTADAKGHTHLIKKEETE